MFLDGKSTQLLENSFSRKFLDFFLFREYKLLIYHSFFVSIYIYPYIIPFTILYKFVYNKKNKI